ncbi:MAG: hypothetical protein HC854_06440 [Flavobacterium sp.]|nr:hypothetical protein [Flavobacterium sp.]
MKHILILIVAFIIGYQLFEIYHNYSLFDVFIIISCIIFFAIFTVNFIKDFSSYQKTKSFVNFSATFLAIFSVFILYLIYLNFNNKINKESILVIINRGDINGVEIDFKKDNTCIVNSYSNLGGSYYYGHYKIKDSIIEIINIKGNDYRLNKFYFSMKDSIAFPFINKSKIDYSQKFLIK